MSVAFCKSTALSILRALRQGDLSVEGRRRHVSLSWPVPPSGKRWTRRKLLEELPAALRDELSGSEIDVATPSDAHRIHARGVKNVTYVRKMPGSSFVEVGGGLTLSSPELVFLEMGADLNVLELALLGMELCGGYVLPARGDGEVRYGVGPVTSVDKLAAFLGQMRRHPRIGVARAALHLVRDSCWSPMEAPLVAFLGEGPEGLGYGVGDLVVNERVRSEATNARFVSKESRVPDIVVAGTGVGVNYDGAGHYDIERVARAALAAAGNAGEKGAWSELEATKREVRRKYADDRRRERDLWASGMTVFTVTKEDLYEEGALDLLAGQVIEALERTSGRDMSSQRAALGDKERARRRWGLLRSVLP